MALFIQNRSSRTVFAAIGYSTPNCPDGDNWSKKGWWRIVPGGSATVRGGASNGAKYFFHAHSDDGSLDWSGSFTTNLPSNAFDWCWPTSSTDSRLRGMRKILVPITSINHTVILQ